MLNKPVVGKYTKDPGIFVTSLGLSDKSGQIWNCGETGFKLQHQPTGVCARKGTRSLSGRTSNNRNNISIMAYVNGSGTAMTPMIVVKGKTQKSFMYVWTYWAKA